jgi:hypothetical protein
LRKWDQASITNEIAEMHRLGENLSYVDVARRRVALLRAATRYFGSWKAAVEDAGVAYDDVRKYHSWTRECIVERIRDLQARGVDLSWRHVSSVVDPRLAAAATKRKHFGSWRKALEAAGISYKEVRRYRQWTDEAIIEGIRARYTAGLELNAKSVEDSDIALITAARRRFETWHKALEAAGLDYRVIVLRRPFRRRRKAQGLAAEPVGTASR